jgi:hypothetical protein
MKSRLRIASVQKSFIKKYRDHADLLTVIEIFLDTLKTL